MTYKFINASKPMQKTPKETLTDDFQENLTDQFKQSTDWYTIKEEFPFASGIYNDIDVRITHAIDSVTGKNLGDDFKNILFPDLNHQFQIGSMYFFDKNYWIVINSEIKRNLAASVTIKRCNEELRWKDKITGKFYSFPCSIGYDIRMPRNYSTAGSALVLPSGFAEVMTQFNAATNTIYPNQRFLFGNTNNWIAYVIEGGGLNNFQRLQTTDEMSTGILRLTMRTNQVNVGQDDLINGIADAFENIYTLSLNTNSVSITKDNSLQLIANVKLNGANVDRSLTWLTSDSLVATVDSNGVVTAIGVGNCTISCNIRDNVAVNDSCAVTVTLSSVDNYSIIMTPISNSILEGQTVTFTTTLIFNGNSLADAFTYSIDASNTVPQSNFVFTIVDGHSFSIRNNSKYLIAPLKIMAVSGTYSRTFDILLKGAW
jgi:hypothetical protein